MASKGQSASTVRAKTVGRRMIVEVVRGELTSRTNIWHGAVGGIMDRARQFGMIQMNPGTKHSEDFVDQSGRIYRLLGQESGLGVSLVPVGRTRTHINPRSWPRVIKAIDEIDEAIIVAFEGGLIDAFILEVP